MNIDNQTILHVKAGHMPPEELLTRILATKPNAFGFAVQEADGADMQTVREDATNLDLENLKGFLKDSLERPSTLYFGSLKEGYDPEDIQPSTITDGDGNTFMTLFVEGTINGHDEPAAHTEQYNLVQGIIIPKIVDWCEDFDGDLDKIMSKINGEVFNKDFLSHVGHRAVLHILPFKGDAVLLGPNTLGINDAEWGWVSRSHGFGETVQEVAAPVVVKKTSWGSGAKKAPAATAIKEQPNGTFVTGGTTLKDVKGVLPPPPQDVATKGEAPRDAEGPVPVFVRPPSWLHKNDDIKQFYMLVGGTSAPPSAWKKNIPVEVVAHHELLKANNYEDFNKYRLSLLLATTGKVASSAPAPTVQQQQKLTKQERLSNRDTAPAAAPEAPITGPVDPLPLPIMEPKDLEKVLDYVAKHLDGNSKEIMPPQEMQKLEAELPVFSEAVGVKLEEMLNWSVSGLFGLAATDPRAVVLWGLEWRKYARQYLMAELKAKSKDNVTMTTEKAASKAPAPEANDKKAGSPVVAATSVPAAGPKKSSWGYGKAKVA